MPHAGDAATGPFAGEACAVVTHLDIDVLARCIQSSLYVYAGRPGMFHDIGERLLQDTQNVQDVLWCQAGEPPGTSLTRQSR